MTGSADGLGLLSAQSILNQGHEVVLHARNVARSKEPLNKLSDKPTVLIGDLSNTQQTIKLAEQVNRLGTFDAVIHNAGIYEASGRDILAVNTLAPYILTCLINKPNRLIYLSSGMHLQGRSALKHIKKDVDNTSYSDSKLHVLAIAKAISKVWKDVYANTVNPGWVPTKMGGKGAPDNLQKGYETQTWLALSGEDSAKLSGCYFFHKEQHAYHPDADDEGFQQNLIEFCFEQTGVQFPQS